MAILTFQEALAESQWFTKRHVLLGNGFSIACRPDIFLYGKLYEQADFTRLSPTAKKAFEALGNLGVVESAMCVLSFMYKQAFPNEKPETFHDWVANQFGERLFSIFFKTYTEKVWGMSCDEISADWAAQRIKGLDLWSAMANARSATRGIIGQLSRAFRALYSPGSDS